MDQNGAFNSIEFLVTFFYGMASALLWLSIAWLSVVRNKRRWVGGFGVLIYVIYPSLNHFVLTPMWIKQTTDQSGFTVPTFDLSYPLFLFAISVLPIGVAFLCVGMMHLSGYRWDVLRRIEPEVEAVGKMVVKKASDG